MGFNLGRTKKRKDDVMEYGKPTAKKVSGCEWYLPAVTTPFGPAPLQHGVREDTRSKAISAARRALSGGAAQKSKPSKAGPESRGCTTQNLAEIAKMVDDFKKDAISDWLGKLDGGDIPAMPTQKAPTD